MRYENKEPKVVGGFTNGYGRAKLGLRFSGWHAIETEIQLLLTRKKAVAGYMVYRISAFDSSRSKVGSVMVARWSRELRDAAAEFREDCGEKGRHDYARTEAADGDRLWTFWDAERAKEWGEIGNGAKF